MAETDLGTETPDTVTSARPRAAEEPAQSTLEPAAGAQLRPDVAGPHHVIIVGGGAGGIELATRLGDTLGRRGKARVTLIDRARAHLWKPLLHEVAAGSMDLGHHETDYLAQAHWHHFRYRIGEMVGLDRARREVHLAPHLDEDGREVTPPRSFRYDTLVIAIGSLTDDFGIPGVAQYALRLDTPEQAARFHRRLVNALIRANAQPGPLRPEQLQVAIIGAGATGVELAAELRNTTRQLAAFGLDRVNPEQDIRLHVIEAAPRIIARAARAAVARRREGAGEARGAGPYRSVSRR